MKLHAPDWQFLVPHAHDFALAGFGSDFETIGQRVALDDERMIARGDKGIGHPHKKVLAVVLNRRGFAVHHAVIYHHLRAEHVSDALVTEAESTKPRLPTALQKKYDPLHH